MITTRIKGDNSKSLGIGPEGEINVTVHSHPIISEAVASFPFRQYFTDNGKATGSNDMLVNGTLTDPIEFYIQAIPDAQTWIKSLHIKLADAGANFNEFGNLSSLTNGLEFVWTTQTDGDKIIHDGIKDNLEFFRLSQQTPTIIDLSGGGADAVVVSIDLAAVFGTPYGVPLYPNTLDRLAFRVRDNLSAGMTEFNIIAYGVQVTERI